MNIFWVHSNLTLNVAYQVVKQKNIPIRDVVFLTSRNLVNTFNEIKTYDLPFSHNALTVNSKYGILWSWFKTLHLIFFILKITKFKRFEYYVPTTLHVFTQIIISLPFCKAFNYIEEGLLFYNEKKEIYINKKVTIKEKIGYFFLYKGYNYLNENYKKIYAINRNVTLFNRDIEVLDSFFDNIPNNDNVYANEIKTILVFDATSVFKFYDEKSHVLALEKLFTFILKDLKINEKLFYKLHPAQYGTNDEKLIKETMKKIFNNLIEVIELEKTFFLESILKNNSLNVIVNKSSFGYYAAIQGHKVCSYANLIAKYNSNYSERIKDNSSNIFFKIVKQINI